MRLLKTRRTRLGAAIALLAAALAAGLGAGLTAGGSGASAPGRLAHPGGHGALAAAATRAGEGAAPRGARRGSHGTGSGQPAAGAGAAKASAVRAQAGCPRGSVPVAGGLKTAASGGSLSVSPGILEHTAGKGGVGQIKIANTTAAAMAVTVALRPWLQAHSGEVAPQRGRTLAGLCPSAGSFTLPAGSAGTVGLSLTRRPAGGSQYGAIEVIGLPEGGAAKGNGVRLGYRLVSSLRLAAPRGAQVYRAHAGGLLVQGSIGHGTLLMAVRNTGNTVSPIGGTVTLSGQGHSLRANAHEKAIVPGQSVNVPLTELPGSLPRGRYAVSVRLTQAGHSLGTVRRTIELR
jgi:hypothetical protein